jgi:hypothetical protein
LHFLIKHQKSSYKVKKSLHLLLEFGKFKAREIWNAKRNILWNEMKKKCQESCKLSCDYWHLREYPYKSIIQIGEETIEKKLFVGGGGGIKYLSEGDYDPQTTLIKSDILMDQRSKAMQKEQQSNAIRR